MCLNSHRGELGKHTEFCFCFLSSYFMSFSMLIKVVNTNVFCLVRSLAHVCIGGIICYFLLGLRASKKGEFQTFQHLRAASHKLDKRHVEKMQLGLQSGKKVSNWFKIHLTWISIADRQQKSFWNIKQWHFYEDV